MKLLVTTLLATLGMLGTGFAGERVAVSKDYKPVEQPVTTCFSDNEWQVDLFGQYSVGEGPRQAGIFRDHGWGGGIGLNYFFHRNIGLGVDAAWLYAKEADYVQDLGRGSGGSHTTLHNFSGSLIFRMPIDELCLAPYLYVGGGATVDGEQWASAHAGGGVEYRIVPQKMGIFVDGRWTYLGDRFGHGDLNYTSARVGFRFIF